MKAIELFNFCTEELKNRGENAEKTESENKLCKYSTLEAVQIANRKSISMEFCIFDKMEIRSVF